MTTEIRASRLLTPDGVFHRADLCWRDGCWNQYSISDAVAEDMPYVVSALPIEFHVHGIGPYDFSEIGPSDLGGINDHARSLGIFCIPTIYLRPERFAALLQLMRAYAELRQSGQLPHILGFALEGPLLGNVGGTPRSGSWTPDRDQWRAICDCGPLGLQYMVLAPDALGSESETGLYSRSERNNVEWILSILLENGIRPALGHFSRMPPEYIAKGIERTLDLVEKVLGKPSPTAVITDHLFNDMPRNLKHAWRGPEERARREHELSAKHIEPWSWENLDELVGMVPAALMRAARDGRLTLSINFDAEHVDLTICKRVVELVGTSCIMAMTDRTQVARMAGERLSRRPGETLWYQAEGHVAAGSLGIDEQMANMRSIHLRESEIWQMFAFAPVSVFGLPLTDGTVDAPKDCTFVSGEGKRSPLYTT